MNDPRAIKRAMLLNVMTYTLEPVATSLNDESPTRLFGCLHHNGYADCGVIYRSSLQIHNPSPASISLCSNLLLISPCSSRAFFSLSL